MENIDKKNCDMCGHSCAGGSCGGCGMQMHGCHGGRHHIVRMILKLILVALIFCFGFNLGQMTGFIKAEYGRGLVGGVNNYGYGMMRGYNYNATPITPTQ
jgi:hypothetical protein